MTGRPAGDAAHRSRWRTFEVVVGLPFLAGAALELAAPRSFPGGLGPALIAAGLALILAGVAVVAAAGRELARRGQPTDPGQPTSSLVTTGIYAFSRNPLYLGGASVLAGIALALDLVWALLFLGVALVACRYLLIAPEERYLAARFGGEYASYTASVRRWLGRSRGAGKTPPTGV